MCGATVWAEAPRYQYKHMARVEDSLMILGILVTLRLQFPFFGLDWFLGVVFS